MATCPFASIVLDEGGEEGGLDACNRGKPATLPPQFGWAEGGEKGIYGGGGGVLVLMVGARAGKTSDGLFVTCVDDGGRW